MPAPADASVIALVLAAGQGRRFGSDKRRALLPDGTSLLFATLQNAQRAFAQVCVVLRINDDPRELSVPTGVEVIYCAEAESGIGHSLAAGIRHLQSQPATAIALLLGDMPWISPDTVQSLIDRATAQRIVFPLVQGMRGHPVLFGRDFWPQLQQLTGDTGAKALLNEHPQACIAVPVDDPGVLRDVDTPAALQD